MRGERQARNRTGSCEQGSPSGGWFACSRVARGEGGEDGWHGNFFSCGGRFGYESERRGRGDQVDGDHVPFNLEKRRERKEDEPEMRLNFNEGKFSAK